MACLKHQVLEHVALVNENMVYSHRVKIHGVILAAVDAHTQVGEFRLQVFLSFLKSALHPAAAVAHGALFQYFKATLHIGKLFRKNLKHRFIGLRYLGELVVRQYDAVPVVVLDFRKHLPAVCRGEILLAGIEYLC